MKHDLKKVAAQFNLGGSYVKAEPYGSGHINDTYAVWVKKDSKTVRYIFQRINHLIFKNPPALMDNIARVTQHVREKLIEAGATDTDRSTLTLIPTQGGEDFLQDEDGLYWRVYLFIENAKTYDVIESTQQAYEAARAFGIFQGQLADLPGPRLSETIPNFHNTRSRFNDLLKAITADPCDRVMKAKAEIDFALKNEAMVDVLLDLLKAGKLEERITHNDTKLNNVMIDDATMKGLSVIDLDTVMPGLSLYDFGDMVRTATNTGAEDEQDLSKVSMNMEMFEALVRGYLSSAGDVLNKTEIEHLTFSGKLITFETGLRFLTDYINGDCYFKTQHEKHNLDRCRTQFALIESIEQQEPEMKELIASICKS